MNRTLLDKEYNKKLVEKKPTTQEMKSSINDFINKFNQIHKKCGFYHIY